MSDEHRTKIANSQILKCLIEHAMGQREMSASQVTAGLGLLNKIMPNLQAMDLNAQTENTHRVISDKPVSENEWAEKHSVGPAAGTAARSH